MPHRISNAAAPISLSFATRSASNAAAEFWSSVDNGIYLSGVVVVVVVGVWVEEESKMRGEERRGEVNTNQIHVIYIRSPPLRCSCIFAVVAFMGTATMSSIIMSHKCRFDFRGLREVM